MYYEQDMVSQTFYLLRHRFLQNHLEPPDLSSVQKLAKVRERPMRCKDYVFYTHRFGFPPFPQQCTSLHILVSDEILDCVLQRSISKLVIDCKISFGKTNGIFVKTYTYSSIAGSLIMFIHSILASSG